MSPSEHEKHSALGINGVSTQLQGDRPPMCVRCLLSPVAGGTMSPPPFPDLSPASLPHAPAFARPPEHVPQAPASGHSPKGDLKTCPQILRSSSLQGAQPKSIPLERGLYVQVIKQQLASKKQDRAAATAMLRRPGPSGSATPNRLCSSSPDVQPPNTAILFFLPHQSLALRKLAATL